MKGDKADLIIMAIEMLYATSRKSNKNAGDELSHLPPNSAN
jgi:hypothetical protein